MNLTDNIEVKKIKEWAKADDKYSFKHISDSNNSYYELFDNKKNIEEYDFDDVPACTESMKKFWEDEDDSILKVCAIAAFKGRLKLGDLNCDTNKTKADDKVDIPDFVYAF